MPRKKNRGRWSTCGNTDKTRKDFQRRSWKKPEWREITKKNDLFEKYYKAQNIIPEAEWEEFMTAFRNELSSTFRLTGSRSQAKRLCFCLKAFYLKDLQNVEVSGQKVDPPKPLPWYPNELAWQVNLPKMFIRKVASMEKFHNFLVHETESGNISRQEAVSMIPALLLDVKPGHKVLDTCAAPGSKTSQIIEMLHSEDSTEFPDGLVIANDLQNKRCYMLVHQSKRLHSPCVMITNNDASVYPTIHSMNEDGNKVPLKFDRILCDVPCSGDGTMRKNPLIWNKWSPRLGLSLHRTQLRILARAVEMLAVGGKIVYSTCTLNPMENEAVVGTLLQKAEGAVELVDVSSELPELIRSPGLLTWKLMDKDGGEIGSCEEGTSGFASGFKQSMLPPPGDTAEAIHLDRCMRVYPHQQDTGGFFIAVLQKKHEAPWENEKRFNKIPRQLPWETGDMTREGKRLLRASKRLAETEQKLGGGGDVASTSKVEGTVSDNKMTVVEEEGNTEGDDKATVGEGEEETKSDDKLTMGEEENTERDDRATVGEGEENTETDDKGTMGEEENTESDAKVTMGEEENTESDDKVTMAKEEGTSDTKPEGEEEEEENLEQMLDHLEEEEMKEALEKQRKEQEQKQTESSDTASKDEDKDGQPPEKKIKLHNLYRQGFKEDPFVFLDDKDEHWPHINSFYGFKDSFPYSKLMTRTKEGKKRNIYLVSKAVKGILEASAEGDSLKVINCGLKTISRSEAEDVDCDFRLIQEGIDMVAPFITKRLIYITQRDVILLLLHDKPFMRKFSDTTRDQLSAVGGMGCIVFIYDPNGKHSNPEDRIKCELRFNGWKAKTSTRVLMCKNDRMHYLTLCGIPPGDKVKEAIRRLRENDDDEIEEEIQSWASADVLTVEPPEGVVDVGFV